MKATPCPDEFKAILKEHSIIELAVLFHELRKFPEDLEYLKAVSDEMKSRQKGAKVIT